MNNQKFFKIKRLEESPTEAYEATVIDRDGKTINRSGPHPTRHECFKNLEPMIDFAKTIFTVTPGVYEYHVFITENGHVAKTFNSNGRVVEEKLFPKSNPISLNEAWVWINQRVKAYKEHDAGWKQMIGDLSFFDSVVASRIDKIRNLILVKGKEYRRNDNAFHNFEAAARVQGITPERALHGLMLKHFVSYQDMLDDIDKGITPEAWAVDEKLGDIIVYMILQEAQLKARIEKRKGNG